MKHRYVIVLASSTAEAHRYARRAHIPNFTYRVPASASSIRGLQVADVHVLPSFKHRRDRHSILAELRYGRDIVMMDVEMPPPANPLGEQMTIDDIDLDSAMAAVANHADALIHAAQVVGTDEFTDLVEKRLELSRRDVDVLAMLEQARQLGPLDDVDLETAYAWHAEREAAKAVEPEKRTRAPRRTKCPQCGDLVLGLAGHVAEKHAPAAPAPSVENFF